MPINDFPAILPQSVSVRFPTRRCNGSPSDTVPYYYVKSTSLSSSSWTPPDENDSIPNGFPGSKMYHDTALALYDVGNPNPTNQAALDRLAKQIATDFYNWKGVAFDRVYNGIIAPDMNGLIDVMTFQMGSKDASTRVYTAPYNGEPEELMHHDPANLGCVSTDMRPLMEMYTPGATQFMASCTSLSVSALLLGLQDGRLQATFDHTDSLFCCTGGVCVNTWACVAVSGCTTADFNNPPGVVWGVTCPISGVLFTLMDASGLFLGSCMTNNQVMTGAICGVSPATCCVPLTTTGILQWQASVAGFYTQTGNLLLGACSTPGLVFLGESTSSPTAGPRTFVQLPPYTFCVEVLGCGNDPNDPSNPTNRPAPIQGATVTISPSGQSGVTGPDGVVCFAVSDPGSYYANVSAPGYQSVRAGPYQVGYNASSCWTECAKIVLTTDSAHLCDCGCYVSKNLLITDPVGSQIITFDPTIPGWAYCRIVPGQNTYCQCGQYSFVGGYSPPAIQSAGPGNVAVYVIFQCQTGMDGVIRMSMSIHWAACCSNDPPGYPRVNTCTYHFIECGTCQNLNWPCTGTDGLHYTNPCGAGSIYFTSLQQVAVNRTNCLPIFNASFTLGTGIVAVPGCCAFPNPNDPSQNICCSGTMTAPDPMVGPYLVSGL